jgi:hypothetical protein
MRAFAGRDTELHEIQKIMSILGNMPATQRRRVLQYINDRIELMPALPPPQAVETLEEGDLLETT